MIVRRPEFKRKRQYRRRARQRNPIGKMLKSLYADLSKDIFNRTTPLLSCFRRCPTDLPEMVWGGTSLYFEVTPGRGPSTTLDTAGSTSPDEVPVNYGGSPQAPL